MVLESQNWQLHRVWSPNFFRDQRGCIDGVLGDVQGFLNRDTNADALRVIDAPAPPSD